MTSRRQAIAFAAIGDVVLLRVLLDPGQPFVQLGLIGLHAGDQIGVKVGRKRRRGGFGPHLHGCFVLVG